MIRLMNSRWVIVLGATLLSGCGDTLSSSPGTVCISGYNQNDRKIHMFWLDDENKSGCWGNPPGRDVDQVYGGGGKFNCGCRVTPGKEVSLYWVFAQSKAEYAAKVPEVQREVRVTIPQPESPSSRYFRAYFMKDGTAKLQWVDNMGAPEIEPSPESGIL